MVVLLQRAGRYAPVHLYEISQEDLNGESLLFDLPT